MDIEAELIKELQFGESSTVYVKLKTASTGAFVDISTYDVKAERDVDIVNQYQNKKILGNTIKEEFDDVAGEEEIWETYIKTKKEKLVLEVKEEPSSVEMDEDSLSEMKTEELLFKSESVDRVTGFTTEIEGPGDDEEEQMWDTNINTKEEKVTPEMKAELSSDDKDKDSLPEIKTEELILKSESEDDNSKTGAHWGSRMINDYLTKKYGFDNCDHSILMINNYKDDITGKHDKNLIKKYGCDNCDYSTYRKNDLARHVMSKHDTNSSKKYGCSDCHYKTCLKNNLKIHIMVKHDKNSIKKYGCEHCDYRSHFKSCLKNHILAKHDNNPSIYLKSDLERHVMSKHDTNSSEKYGCSHCDYRTCEKNNLKTHIMAKHDEKSIKKYSCERCDYRSHFKSCLKRHILAKHDGNPFKKYGCDYCNYRVYRKDDLKRHVMSKHYTNSSRKYGCGHCDYKTHMKIYLKNHIIAKHDKNAIKKYSCDHCDYGTQYKSHLDNHIRAKHNQNLN